MLATLPSTDGAGKLNIAVKSVRVRVWSEGYRFWCAKEGNGESAEPADNHTAITNLAVVVVVDAGETKPHEKDANTGIHDTHLACYDTRSRHATEEAGGVEV